MIHNERVLFKKNYFKKNLRYRVQVPCGKKNYRAPLFTHALVPVKYMYTHQLHVDPLIPMGSQFSVTA